MSCDKHNYSCVSIKFVRGKISCDFVWKICEKMAARNNVKKKIEVTAREHGYIELKEEQKRVMIDFINYQLVLGETYPLCCCQIFLTL